MAKALSPLKVYRQGFGKIERIVDISNLIEMQKESYHVRPVRAFAQSGKGTNPTPLRFQEVIAAGLAH